MSTFFLRHPVYNNSKAKTILRLIKLKSSQSKSCAHMQRGYSQVVIVFWVQSKKVQKCEWWVRKLIVIPVDCKTEAKPVIDPCSSKPIKNIDICTLTKINERKQQLPPGNL